MSPKINNEWWCPYCDERGETKWNKQAYRELMGHIKEKHTDEAFSELVGKYNINAKKHLIADHEGYFSVGKT
jgi:hypothetical protein